MEHGGRKGTITIKKVGEKGGKTQRWGINKCKTRGGVPQDRRKKEKLGEEK